MLALFAGQGSLPGLVMDAMVRAGTPVVLCEMEQFPVKGLGETKRLQYRLEGLGPLLAALEAEGVTDVCFAGAISRPDVDLTKVDAVSAPLVQRLVGAFGEGDDALLREVLEIFEDRGFVVRAAHELAPMLLPEAGVLTRVQPIETHENDADKAVAVVAAMGVADVGQACVVSGGQVLAIEAIPGTAWMLRSLIVPKEDAPSGPIGWAFDMVAVTVSDWAEWLSGINGQRDPALPKGGILFKAPKPDQDRRIDLPTIGPETVMLAAEAGLDGIVIEAGGVMVIDAPQCVKIANGVGLFLWLR